MDNEHRLIDALPGLVWTALPDGRCDFVNALWSAYTGLGADEAAGHRWLSLIHPSDLPNVRQRWQAIVNSGEAGELEARLRRRDGAYRWFSMAVNPLRDESHRVIKWCALNTDVEDRRRAEEALSLRQLDFRLRSLVDTIPMMAWTTEADGYCDFLNQRWLDYAGLTLEQGRGWGWGAVIHPDDLDALVLHWQDCLTSGNTLPTEARMRRSDGVYRWFLFVGNPLRDEAGNIVKWFGANVDIEDRKLAEDALRASERNLIQIINTIPTTAWSTRPDGYCDFLSDRWLDYAGYTVEEALGWNWGSVIHPEDAP